MALTKSGQYFGNEQQARMRDAMPKPAPIRPEEDQAPDEQPSITISKTDSGFHFSELGGEEGDLASIEEVDAKVKECLGVEANPGGDELAEAQGADAEGAGY